MADIAASILERGSDHAIRSDLLNGQTFAVQFADPNACKALHIGHLYDALIGNGIASMFEAAGARVFRHCFVSDLGRNICEAMAGYCLYYSDQDPVALGVKPDTFVGVCYSDYVKDYYSHQGNETRSETPIGREEAVVMDLADDLLRRWHSNDPAVRQLWEKIRDWVMAGQQLTFARLGISFDRIFWGSDMREDLELIIKDGLSCGAFKLGRNDAVVYDSGLKEYSTMVVTRGDGFGTENGRQLALMTRLEDFIGTIDRYITVDGGEWRPSCHLYDQIQSKLGRHHYEEKARRIFHGMISYSGSIMKSSDGGVVLIDDLLDRLAGSEMARALSSRYGADSCSREKIGNIVLAIYLLSRKISKPLHFSYDDLSWSAQSPGWAVAEAYCMVRSCDNRREAEDIDFSDGACRYAIMQSQTFRQALRDGTESFDLAPVIAYVRRLSEAVRNEPAANGVHRLLKAPLLAGAAAVGI